MKKSKKICAGANLTDATAAQKIAESRIKEILSGSKKTDTLAETLFQQAFPKIRNPRSIAYKCGVLSCLEFRFDGKRISCPYEVESSGNDAWYAGNEEGHRIYKTHASQTSEVAA